MSKYYVKFTLEVRKVDDKDAVKSEGILWKAGDVTTTDPAKYIKKALKEQAGKIAELTAESH